MPKVQRIPEYSSAHLLIISLLCFLFSPTEPLLRRMQTRLSFIPEHVSVHFLKSQPFFSATPQYPPTRKINIDLIVLCKLHAILKFHQFFLITLFRVKEEGKKIDPESISDHMSPWPLGLFRSSHVAGILEGWKPLIYRLPLFQCLLLPHNEVWATR